MCLQSREYICSCDCNAVEKSNFDFTTVEGVAELLKKKQIGIKRIMTK